MLFKWLFRKSKKVLIVEDDDDLRSVLRDHLEKKGYRVLDAENGNEALKVALHENPNAILLDLMLPQRDGISFLEQLRRDPEWGHGVPVIILTNLVATTSRWDRVTALGIENYIEKADFSLERVANEVEKAVKKKVKRKQAPKHLSPENQPKPHADNPEEG